MWGVIGAVGKFFGFLGGLLDWRKRKAHEQAGRNKEKLRQSESAREASQEMREIENEVEGLPAIARRDLARRWVWRSEVGDGNDG